MHNALDKGQVGGKVLQKEVEELWSNQIKSSECTAIRTPVKHHRLHLVRINRDKLVPQSFRGLEFFLRVAILIRYSNGGTPQGSHETIKWMDIVMDGWMMSYCSLLFISLHTLVHPSINHSVTTIVITVNRGIEWMPRPFQEWIYGGT